MEQKPPVFFLQKKKAKNEKNMLRSLRILIFQSPKKKKGLFLHFWKNTGITSPKKKLKNTLLLRYYLFFLETPSPGPTRLVEVLDRKFWFRGFFSENSPCHTSQRRLQTPDGDGSHRLAPTKGVQVDNQWQSKISCLIKN